MEAVQEKLVQQERELQAEIELLREELRKDQDPSRMQLIQEMISVRACIISGSEKNIQVEHMPRIYHECTGTFRPNVSHT